MFHHTETGQLFDEFGYMRWNDTNKLLLVSHFLDELEDEGLEILPRLRGYLQEQADVEEGYCGSIIE